MAGRGSFIESFPLFGYDLHDYDVLSPRTRAFAATCTNQEKITWNGQHRPAINNLGVYPRPLQEKLPVWVAVGGTPESVVRAASLGLPMALAIIGSVRVGWAFCPSLSPGGRRIGARSGADAIEYSRLDHGFIADDSKQAADDYFPPSQW